MLVLYMNCSILLKEQNSCIIPLLLIPLSLHLLRGLLRCLLAVSGIQKVPYKYYKITILVSHLINKPSARGIHVPADKRVLARGQTRWLLSQRWGQLVSRLHLPTVRLRFGHHCHVTLLRAVDNQKCLFNYYLNRLIHN